MALLVACGDEERPTAPAIRNRDSLPIMSTTGVSKLISDSGIIKYKIVAETWDVYDKTKPQRQVFINGIFMEKFDPHYKVEMYLSADTAYWFDQNLWELRGNIEIRKADGLIFKTSELFWDMSRHQVYSHKYVDLKTATQELRGVGFRSDEELSNYEVLNSAGSFPMPDATKQNGDTSTAEPQRPDAGGVTPPAPTPQRPAMSPANRGTVPAVKSTIPAVKGPTPATKSSAPAVSQQAKANAGKTPSGVAAGQKPQFKTKIKAEHSSSHARQK